MNISFKGIENLKILKHTRESEGPLLLTNGRTVPAKETTLIVKAKYKLTDEGEKDLTEYNKVIKNVQKTTNWDFREPGNEDECTITAFYTKRNVLGKDYYSTKLLLNNNDLELVNDSLLPIYTYLAKFTKKLTNSDITRPNQKPYTQGIHDTIHEKACQYFDVKA